MAPTSLSPWMTGVKPGHDKRSAGWHYSVASKATGKIDSNRSIGIAVSCTSTHSPLNASRILPTKQIVRQMHAVSRQTSGWDHDRVTAAKQSARHARHDDKAMRPGVRAQERHHVRRQGANDFERSIVATREQLRQPATLGQHAPDHRLLHSVRLASAPQAHPASRPRAAHRRDAQNPPDGGCPDRPGSDPRTRCPERSRAHPERSASAASASGRSPHRPDRCARANSAGLREKSLAIRHDRVEERPRGILVFQVRRSPVGRQLCLPQRLELPAGQAAR